MLRPVPNLRVKTQGFSLVELMVGIAIMAVLASLALPSYKVWMQNSRIRATAESIQNGLQIARAEAVKRNLPVQFELSDDASWTFGCVTVSADCPGTIQSRAAGEGSSADVTVVTSPAASDTVEFNSMGRVSAAPVPFTQVNIDSSASADDRPLRVTLGVGGNTRMCDPYSGLSTSDPRKC